MKHRLSALAFACALPFAASAATTDWGVHDALEVAATLTPVGSFSDTYLFSLSGPSSLFSSAVANNLTQVLGITNFAVTLFGDTPGVDRNFGSFSLGSATGSESHSFGNLLAGNYYYVVSGTGNGSLGGFYSLSSTLTAVPEPETSALFLGGLGAIAFLLRRFHA